MAESTIWWLLTGAAIAVELVTGTFYLLMLACGMAVAAVGAHLGFNIATQFVLAAFVGGGAVAAWHVKRSHSSGELRAEVNPNVNLDIGETINVLSWNVDGTADVHYRGANWTAIHRANGIPNPGIHRVSEMVGNRLLVDKI